MPKADRGPRILMIEDNSEDVYLFRDALKEIGGTARVWALRDAETAIDWINDCGEAEWESLRPDLILLDLNLPHLSGNDLLLILKSHSRTRSVPVIVMSSSNSPEEVRRAYDSYASCFVRKPGNLEDFIHAMKGMQMFWTETARLPSRNRRVGLK
jgi:two-component system, chemotaxis family, response regulator Rcp1